MHWRILAALFPEYLVSAIGEDFVDVHVVRRSGPCLENVDDELVAIFSVEYFVRCLHDCIGELCVEPACFLVGQRSRALDPNCRVDERRQRLDTADWKILNGLYGLHSRQTSGRYIDY